MTFPKDFQEFLNLLKKHDIEYVIVGGYALAFHGYIRNTGDLDLLVNSTPANKSSMVKVFSQFGFSEETSENLFPKKGHALGIGTPPLRIEILTEISGLTFQEAFRDKASFISEGTEIFVINYNALIVNKSSTNRPKDKSDVLELQNSVRKLNLEK